MLSERKQEDGQDPALEWRRYGDLKGMAMRLVVCKRKLTKFPHDILHGQLRLVDLSNNHLKTGSCTSVCV